MKSKLSVSIVSFLPATWWPGIFLKAFDPFKNSRRIWTQDWKIFLESKSSTILSDLKKIVMHSMFLHLVWQKLSLINWIWSCLMLRKRTLPDGLQMKLILTSLSSRLNWKTTSLQNILPLFKQSILVLRTLSLMYKSIFLFFLSHLKTPLRMRLLWTFFISLSTWKAK